MPNPKTSSKQIVRVIIDNVLGIEHLEVEPGSYTVIAGQNGSGKTSVLTAIQSALKRGHDATLLRKGAAHGAITLELSDGSTITKTITPDKSHLGLRNSLGEIRRPQEYLDSIHDAFSIGPLTAFLNGDKKSRYQWLLEALPLELDAQALATALEYDEGEHLPAVNGKDALEVLDSHYRRTFDNRTGVNGSVKSKRATVTNLSETLPAESADVNWTERIQELTREWEDAIGAQQSESELVNEEYQALHQALRDARDAELERLRREHDAACAAARTLYEQDHARAILKRDSEQAAIEAAYRPRTANLKADLATTQERAAQTATIAQQRRIIATLRKELAVEEDDAAKFTRILENIKALKTKMLEQAAIEGLGVRDGDIFIDGVPFDRVNRARQIRVAFQVAVMKSGDLGIVCLDNMEALDAETMELLHREAIESGIQVIAARVIDPGTVDGLQITTD